MPAGAKVLGEASVHVISQFRQKAERQAGQGGQEDQLGHGCGHTVHTGDRKRANTCVTALEEGSPQDPGWYYHTLACTLVQKIQRGCISHTESPAVVFLQVASFTDGLAFFCLFVCYCQPK